MFYFAHVEKPQELQEIATAVRSTANVKRVFINSRLTALSTRGTPDQIASAERLIKELDMPR